MKKTILFTILILACLVLVGASCKDIATIMSGGAIITGGPQKSGENIQDESTESNGPLVNPGGTKPSLLDIIKTLNPINIYKIFTETELKMVPKERLPEGSLNTSDTSGVPDIKEGYQIFLEKDGEKIQYSAPSQ